MKQDTRNASFIYSVALLKTLLSMQLITENEFRKTVSISSAHYDAEQIYV